MNTTTSFSVTKVRVAFECPRLFYLGHRYGGSMVFLPNNSSGNIGTQFHHLADRFHYILLTDPRFADLFQAKVDPTPAQIEAISLKIRQLLYQREFFPLVQKISQSRPRKVADLGQVWEAMGKVIEQWAELLLQNRQYTTPEDLIPSTLISLRPSVRHVFNLPNGNTQLVRGRFDSLIYSHPKNSLVVIEYKTYTPPDQSSTLVQVALYSYMLRQQIGRQVDSAIYSVLPEWQQLKFQGDVLDQGIYELIAQKLAQMQVWSMWEPGDQNPPPPTNQPDFYCKICPQRTKCQQFFEPQADVTLVKTTKHVPETEFNPQELVKVLAAFKVAVDYVGMAIAPAFVRVKLKPHQGVKVSAILRCAQDLQVQMGLEHAPLITTQAGHVSLDIPRPDRQIAKFSDYISPVSVSSASRLAIAIGVNTENELVEADLADANSCHFLVGGTTGSGKSEFLRSLLLSLLYRHSPAQLKIVLVDPKRVSFPEFEEIPWLYAPIIKAQPQAIELLEELVKEMESRYLKFEQTKTNNLATYNAIATQPLPSIVCIFDEYADMMAEKDSRTKLELQVKRLGAMARAAGIHLIIATQRPEATVVTPIIRSNLPGRVALRTASTADSAIILGNKEPAAAYLFGKGDLLYQTSGSLLRLQSLYADRFCLN